MSDIASNWQAFIGFVAKAYTDGLTDREIGSRVAGMQVRWGGKIADFQLGDGKLAAIALAMPHVPILVSDGYNLVGDHLSLPLRSESCREKCRSLKKGQDIAFSATLASNDGLFPTVGFVKDEEPRKIFLTLRLQYAEVN